MCMFKCNAERQAGVRGSWDILMWREKSIIYRESLEWVAKKRVGRKQRRRAKSRNRNKHTRLVDREKSLFSSFHSFPFWQCRQCHQALFNINIQIVSHSLAFNIYTKNQKTKKKLGNFIHIAVAHALTTNTEVKLTFFLFFSLFDRPTTLVRLVIYSCYSLGHIYSTLKSIAITITSFHFSLDTVNSPHTRII